MVLRNRLRESAAIIVVIGPQWRGSDPLHNRLFDPDDYVRWELREALALGLPILPVLVEDASMPAQQDLPDDLKEFSVLQALSLRDPGFEAAFASVLEFLERAGAHRRPHPELLRWRPWLEPACLALAQTTSASFLFAHIGAPIVPWSDVVLDTWYVWAPMIILSAGLAYLSRARLGLRLGWWALAATTAATAALVLAIYPGVVLEKKASSAGSAESICDSYETDTRLYATFPGAKYQGPMARPSFCQGEAFSEKHFEIRVRTGWLYRKSLTGTVRAETMPPSSGPPVRVADIAVDKGLSARLPFLAPDGSHATFRAAGRVPAEFTVLVTCWYDGSVTRPASAQVSIDLSANDRRIVVASRTFSVDW